MTHPTPSPAVGNTSVTTPAQPAQSYSLTVAATGDLHLCGTDADATVVRSVMNAVSDADVLAVCGDLTCHGRPEELRAFAEAIGTFAATVVTVLGLPVLGRAGLPCRVWKAPRTASDTGKDAHSARGVLLGSR